MLNPFLDTFCGKKSVLKKYVKVGISLFAFFALLGYKSYNFT